MKAKFTMTIVAALSLWATSAQAMTVLGTGNGALVGNDLTDLGNDGNEGAYNPNATPLVYNIQNIHMDVASSINYHPGNSFQFGGDSAYSTISGGAGLGGDDFSVRAQAFLRFNVAGTYSIGAGSDDGRLVDLSLVSGTYSGITSTGGQITGALTTPTTFGFDNPTGNNTSGGVFNVTAGTVLQLDTFMFERGGGDSFEVSIKSGSDTTPGGPGDGWSLLSDGTLSIDVSTNAAFSDTNFTVKAFNIVGGGGSNDNDLNTTSETRVIWNAIDGGQGTGTLNIPNPPSLGGFDAEFFSSNEPGFGGGEFAFNVFDNQTGGGNNKWCCGAGAGNPIAEQIVGADFSGQYPGGVVLEAFTLTSSNDTPARDPRVFFIEGSNDTTDGLDGTWTVIYSRLDPNSSDWGNTRNQVIRYSPGDGDLFQTNQAFTAFRMRTTATGANSGAFFAISEIEFFGSTVNIPEPATGLLGLLALAGLGRRRHRTA